MTQELISILNTVKTKLTDESDLLWTWYNTVKEFRDELDTHIEKLNKGDTECLEYLNMLFAATAPIQEHSLQNGWSDEYMRLADRFDCIYARIKNEHPI